MSRPPAIAVLDSPEVTQKILEAILESANGRRALSRLARTCRAWLDPALNVLWRELDSLAPVIGLFPPHLLKKTRKPGLGLTAPPQEKDWEKILKYGGRVLRITYDEFSNNVSASIFPIFEEYRPRTYILPNLQHLTWKIITPDNLDRAGLFLTSGRMKLQSFTLNSSVSLPDTFTDHLLAQDRIEKFAVVAPGALSPTIGKWVAYLPRLKSLQLDLSSRSAFTVNGFFKDVRSGESTPDSIESHTDSGVYSGEEVDFTEIRKSLLDLTGDAKKGSVFAALTQLQLTGVVSNISTFLGHLSSPLAQLDLVIEDPPDAGDWRDLSTMICEKFGGSLTSLRIGATLSSKYGDLVRSTSRAAAAPAPSRLSLEHLLSLPVLRTISVDLPESICFVAADIARLAEVAPNLEEVRLCPLARFSPATPPQLTLENLAPLVKNCRRLNTLAVVIHARPGSAEASATSDSLLWLHVGHSWVADTLQVAILLSHFAPHLETIKWFLERNRPGFNEANARSWQKNLRLTERRAVAPAQKEVVIEYVEVAAPRPSTSDKAIDATVVTVDRGVEAKPSTAEFSAQAVPSTRNWATQVSPSYVSIMIDATPPTVEMEVDATPQTVDTQVDATPELVDIATAVDPTGKDESEPDSRIKWSSPNASLLSLTSILSLFGFLCRAVVSSPLGFPFRMLQATFGLFKRRTESMDRGDVALDTLNVRP
ncbi:hypothetical protein C8F04DRAFT_1208752 [Mycena alexandri]|uniref:F-box domain-containing protein n=1 Tax=Mycena alexandri TaxID=1745969 RepID=A0AAD6T6M0_9AGAR|nr:hypothetical protein C8F04DRAFT_1208752 [Mycena alexandri]